jgi:hypothetical protein
LKPCQRCAAAEVNTSAKRDVLAEIRALNIEVLGLDEL